LNNLTVDYLFLPRRDLLVMAEIPEKTERAAIVAAVDVFRVHSNCNVCNREREDEVEEQTDAAQNA